MSQKEKLETLYRDVKYPSSIDWWSAHYAEDELDVLISNSRHLDIIRQKIENNVWQRIVPANGRVLDLACGRGFFSSRLKDAVGDKVNVIGLDLSETVLQSARSDHDDIPFVLGRGEILPFKDSSFDTVMVICAFEHIEDQPDPVISEIHRVLKKGGYFYLCLHKPFVDPFFIPNIATKISKLKTKFESICNYPDRIGFTGTLRELRKRIKKSLIQTGFSEVESNYLLHQINWKFYKKLSPGLIPRLIQIGKLLNRLPFTYYKNLEYWLLQKHPKDCS